MCGWVSVVNHLRYISLKRRTYRIVIYHIELCFLVLQRLVHPVRLEEIALDERGTPRWRRRRRRRSQGPASFAVVVVLITIVIVLWLLQLRRCVLLGHRNPGRRYIQTVGVEAVKCEHDYIVSPSASLRRVQYIISGRMNTSRIVPVYGRNALPEPALSSADHQPSEGETDHAAVAR